MQNFHGFPDDRLCFRDEEKKYESLEKYKDESRILLETPLINSSPLTINEGFPLLNNEFVETEFFIKTSHDSHSFDEGVSKTIWDDTSLDSNHLLQFQPMITKGPHLSCTISQSCNFIDIDHSSINSYVYIFHDRVADGLEASYLKNFPFNGKALFSVYTSKKFSGKHDASNFLLLTYHFLLIIVSVVFLTGMKMLRWLHWLFHFT